MKKNYLFIKDIVPGLFNWLESPTLRNWQGLFAENGCTKIQSLLFSGYKKRQHFPA